MGASSEQIVGSGHTSTTLDEVTKFRNQTLNTQKRLKYSPLYKISQKIESDRKNNLAESTEDAAPVF